VNILIGISGLGKKLLNCMGIGNN